MPCILTPRIGAAVWVTQVLSVSTARCPPPNEPKEREVNVALRAGGLSNQRLDQEFERLRKKSSIRPSLPQDLAQGGWES